MLTIRRATLNDQLGIADFNCRLAWESEKKKLDSAVAAAGVHAALKDPNGKGIYYLACDGSEVIGQCQVTLEWSDWRNGWFWWVQSVYVREDRRGQGVFREIYQHVRREATEAGDVLALRLYVERNNHGARSTYERLGMKAEPYDMMTDKIFDFS
jgi:GNAT superfamily N-acetyltransferase